MKHLSVLLAATTAIASIFRINHLHALRNVLDPSPVSISSAVPVSPTPSTTGLFIISPTPLLGVTSGQRTQTKVATTTSVALDTTSPFKESISPTIDLSQSSGSHQTPELSISSTIGPSTSTFDDDSTTTPQNHISNTVSSDSSSGVPPTPVSPILTTHIMSPERSTWITSPASKSSSSTNSGGMSRITNLMPTPGSVLTPGVGSSAFVTPGASFSSSIKPTESEAPDSSIAPQPDHSDTPVSSLSGGTTGPNNGISSTVDSSASTDKGHSTETTSTTKSLVSSTLSPSSRTSSTIATPLPGTPSSGGVVISSGRAISTVPTQTQSSATTTPGSIETSVRDTTTQTTSSGLAITESFSSSTVASNDGAGTLESDTTSRVITGLPSSIETLPVSFTAPTSTDVPITTYSSLPPGASLRTITDSTYTSNTVASIKFPEDSEPTLVPIIIPRSGGPPVACLQCLPPGPNPPSMAFNIPGPDGFCVRILGLKIGNCPSPGSPSNSDSPEPSNDPSEETNPPKSESIKSTIESTSRSITERSTTTESDHSSETNESSGSITSTSSFVTTTESSTPSAESSESVTSTSSPSSSTTTSTTSTTSTESSTSSTTTEQSTTSAVPTYMDPCLGTVPVYDTTIRCTRGHTVSCRTITGEFLPCLWSRTISSTSTKPHTNGTPSRSATTTQTTGTGTLSTSTEPFTTVTTPHASSTRFMTSSVITRDSKTIVTPITSAGPTDATRTNATPSSCTHDCVSVTLMGVDWPPSTPEWASQIPLPKLWESWFSIHPDDRPVSTTFASRTTTKKSLKTSSMKPTTTTMGNGDVVLCTSFSKNNCIGTTISTAKPYATGTCNIHIQEIYVDKDRLIPVIGVTDDAGKSIAYHAEKEPIDWGSTVTIPRKKLEYDLKIEFLKDWLQKRDRPDPGSNTRPDTLKYKAYDVVIDTGTVKWSTDDNDEDSLPRCEVGGWDGGNDWYFPVKGRDWIKGILEGLPLDSPTRDMDCRWKC